jgi:hypothetical protein
MPWNLVYANIPLSVKKRLQAVMAAGAAVAAATDNPTAINFKPTS